MGEETKKINQTGQDAKAAEVAEQDLDSVSGGGAGDPINGVSIGLGKKPYPGGLAAPKPSGGVSAT